MNYLDYTSKYQYPTGPLPTTGNKDTDAKLQHMTELYQKDIPLSGTDPLGEFYVATVVGDGAFKLIDSFLKHAVAPVVKHSIEVAGGKVNKYLTKSGNWNTELIQSDIKQGILDARAFLESDVKAAANQHNKELATRLGMSGFSPDAGIYRAAVAPAKRQFTTSTKATSGVVERGLGGQNPAEDVVTYNLTSKDLQPTAFHEELHRGNIGEGNIFDLTNNEPLRKKIIDTESFTQFKVNHLLKNDLNLPYAEYLRQDGEAAANILEVAYRAGIKPGQPYPGAEEVLKTLEQIKKTVPEKSFVIDNLDTSHPKRIWDALTGKYFIAVPAVGSYDYLQQQNQK